MGDLLYLIDWIDDKCHIYCKDGSWQYWLDCYRDWSRVLTADWNGIWQVKESLPPRYSDTTDCHIARYTKRSIYLLVKITEESERHCKYTPMRKLYADGWYSAEKYFDDLLDDYTFLTHLSDVDRYEITIEQVESLELELSKPV